MTFYEALPSPLDSLQQGDVLKGVPFSYFGLNNAILAGHPDPVDLTLGNYDGSFVVARLEYSYGILLSQTCDLQQDLDEPEGIARKSIVIARALPIEQAFGDYKEAKPLTHVNTLANTGKSPTAFYLPPTDVGGVNLPRLVVDLLDTQRFASDNLSAVKSMACLRLSVPALQALQERCAYGFGRYAAPDNLYYTEAEREELSRKFAEKARRAAEKRPPQGLN